MLGLFALTVSSIAQEPMNCAMLGDTKNVLPMGFLKNNRSNEPKVIPIVVHIVHSPAIPNSFVPFEAIQPAIDQLNVDFEGTSISFTLAGYDYTNLQSYTWHDAYANGQVCFPTYQTQITILANDIAWDISEYCNVYVIPKMCSTILGFAYVGYGPDNADDGAWVLTQTFGVGTWSHLNPSYNENETLTHEMGHYCGLFHTFNLNPGSCGGQNPDIPCEYEGDYVCDTPPTKASSGCPGVPGYYCPISTYDGGVPFNARNHMDYGPQACRNEFTAGQIQRMHTMLEYQRYELYSDESVIPFCPGDFNQDGHIGTPDMLILLANYGCIGCSPYQGDATLDYNVGSADLNWILANWGEACGDGIGMLTGNDFNLPQLPVSSKHSIPYKDLAALLTQEPRPILHVNYYDVTGRLVNIIDMIDTGGIYLVEIIFIDGGRMTLKTTL